MSFPFYKRDRKESKDPKLPEPALKDLDDWEGYEADEDLEAAVNVALLLGQPLLLTGEPGTGKTQLPFHLSNQFGWGDPFVFEAKSTSNYRDLFYTYDALGRFHDRGGIDGKPADPAKTNEPALAIARALTVEASANPTAKPPLVRDPRQARDYIEYNALGRAILRTREQKDVERYLGAGHKYDGPKSSVVLIDEIDKAPRDFPNDILREIENLYFKVPEIDLEEIEASDKHRVIVVVTSNSEKNLPPAFLRRCTFFHIQNPSEKKLRQILASRLRGMTENDAFYVTAVAFYNSLRKAGLEKSPATAELIAWVAYLRARGLNNLSDKDILRASLSVLVKSPDDLKKAVDLLPTL